MPDQIKVNGSVRIGADGSAEVSLKLPFAGIDAASKPLPNSPDPPSLAYDDSTRAHSPDFTSVRWDGELYKFSPRQRIIVAALWEAKESGCEFVGQEYLLELAESAVTRIRDLFKHHPAWGKMIVSAVPGGPPGAYRLAE